MFKRDIYGPSDYVKNYLYPYLNINMDINEFEEKVLSLPLFGFLWKEHMESGGKIALLPMVNKELDNVVQWGSNEMFEIKKKDNKEVKGDI